MILLDGKIASQSVTQNLKHKVEQYINQGYRPPHLAAILIGNNGASETYVASKIKNCEAIGFKSSLIRFDENITQNTLLEKIEELNNDLSIDGILVQLPLPKHIDENSVILKINPKKDVDGFHPINAGKLMQGLPSFIPATPFGITILLDYYKIETKGKHAVVIGRSNIVGRPMSVLLSGNYSFGNCTVTLCHSHTHNLIEICKQADIIVAAIGKPNFIDDTMIKDGAILIDVGITRVDDETAAKGFRIKGDVNFESVKNRAGAISPVPGGVGLMTIAGLLTNTLKAYEENFIASI
jgi:methylenetetrahydrofolate dehydrogenase (NADP+) / methenyltetrahydrofolate cyclohydrolase